ncbi:germ cell nuclear acidic protein [Engraulis encrasicolus]|uniref:germ cell nuclear acidic protein n=1 Tax=Engraulis encrasicolus TaxID=184585 RepID=UPI002FD7850C
MYSTSLYKSKPLVLEVTDDEDSSEKENCSRARDATPILLDSSDGEFDKILERLKPRRTKKSAKKNSQQIPTTCSDDSFESLISCVKTPVSVPRKGSVSRQNGPKQLPKWSTDDNSATKTKKPPSSQATLKPLQNSQLSHVPHGRNAGAASKIITSSNTKAASAHLTPSNTKAASAHLTPSNTKAASAHLTPSNTKAASAHLTPSNTKAASALQTPTGRVNPVRSTTTAVPSSAPPKTSVCRPPDVSSDSDDSFEKFLNRVKTPKAQPKQRSVSGSEDSLKNFIVDSSDDDDFVFDPSKNSTSKALPKSKPSEQTPKVERCPPSNYDSPVFLTDDDDDDDDDDRCTITSTWKTRHSKPSVASPLTVSHVPSPRPKTTCTKSKAWSSSDEQEEEVDSLLNRLKKNLRLHSDSKATPKNVLEPKQKPCLSDPTTKGSAKPSGRLEKGAPTARTPVQPPKLKPISMTEPRATSGSRIAGCKTPGCFLQSLSDPTSAHCRSFKQNKEELTSKLYRLYNSSVFEDKLPSDMSVSWCNKMRKTAGFCITGQERGTGHRYARIRLSVKVCDSADRLRDTLVHEMCHAAPWLIHGVRDGHGPIWKMFARKATLAHPELPMVSRCHSYDIKYKFQYQCSRCKNTIGRHSKSLDTQRFVCALCTGQLVLLTPTSSRGPTPFAIYVKENYKTIRQQLVGQSHGDVMRKLSADFASKTRLSES